MHRKFLLCLLFGLFCFGWCSCAHFDLGQKEGVYSEEVMALLTDLDKISYWPYQYVEHEFDCSNMVALLHDLLINKGYSCQIVRGLSILKFFTSSHVWLVVERKGKKFLVDVVVKRIMKKRFFAEFIFRQKFSSLEELRRYHIKHGGDPKEYRYPQKLFDRNKE